MRVIVLMILWACALGYAAWLLYAHGHYIWSGLVPIIGISMVEVRERNSAAASRPEGTE